MQLPVRVFQTDPAQPKAPPTELDGFDAEGPNEDLAREAARKKLEGSGWVVRALSFSPVGGTGIGITAYVFRPVKGEA